MACHQWQVISGRSSSGRSSSGRSSVAGHHWQVIGRSLVAGHWQVIGGRSLVAGHQVEEISLDPGLSSPFTLPWFCSLDINQTFSKWEFP